MKPDRENLVIGFIVLHLNYVLEVAERAVIIMFVAAVVAKRFEVFAAVGFVESLAWSAGYGLVRSMVHRVKGE